MMNEKRMRDVNKSVVKGTAVLIVMSLVTAIMNGIQPMLIKNIIDLLYGGNFLNAKVCLLYFFMTILIVLVMEFIGKYYHAGYKKYLLRHFRMGVVTSILEMKPTEFYSVEPNEYTSLLNNEIPLVVEESYLLLPNIVFQSFSILVYGSLLLSINGWLACIILAMNLIALLMPKFFKVEMQKYKDNSICGLRKYNSVISDLVSGFRTIKHFAYEFDFFKNFTEQSNEQLTNQKMYETKKAFADISIGIVLFSTTLLILFIGVDLIQTNSISVGGLVAVLQISELIIGPIIGLTSDINVFSSNMNIRKELVSKYNIFRKADTDSPVTRRQLSKVETETIEYKNVSFKYNTSECLMDDFNFKFEKGKKYLIVGPNGTGKSTLVKLLMNEFEPNEGTICINQNDSNQKSGIFDHLNIGYATQMPYIFNATLCENILLSRDYGDVNFKKSLEIAAIDNTFMELRLEKMSDKLNALSGGERQKISVARAIYSNPDVVIFDEATSQMDERSSTLIEKHMLENPEILFINISHNINEDLLELYDAIIDFGKFSHERVS